MASSKIRVCVVPWLALCAMAGGGCGALLGKEDNPQYCASPPCSPPTPTGCTGNADCTASGAGVCDTASQSCVQCTAAEATACIGTAPVCGTDHACRGCTAHSECASSACSPADGSCLAGSQIAYVDSMGADNPSCSQAAPCKTIAAALAAGPPGVLPYIKIHGSLSEAVLVNGGRVVTVLADPGATLTSPAGNIVTISGLGTMVAIHDLTISGARDAAVGVSVEDGGTLSLAGATISGNAGGGISVSTGGAVSLTATTISGNAGGGITAQSGSLVIDQATIVGNGGTNPGIVVFGGSIALTRSSIKDNPGGGVSIAGGSAAFSIVNNEFLTNGATGSQLGALSLASASDTDLLEFNTFYHNVTSRPGAAVQCTSGSPGFAARANIMFSNGLGVVDQMSGACMYVSSLGSPGALPPGTANHGGDPMFVNADAGDFHLKTDSPVAAAANQLALRPVELQDFDGNPRGTAPVNIGALQTQRPAMQPRR